MLMNHFKMTQNSSPPSPPQTPLGPHHWINKSWSSPTLLPQKNQVLLSGQQQKLRENVSVATLREEPLTNRTHWILA